MDIFGGRMEVIYKEDKVNPEKLSR